MDLFANLRPARVFDALVESSSLKANLVKGLDILIVREATSGVYFGLPRGVETIDDNEKKATDTQSYTTHEIVELLKLDLILRKKDQISLHLLKKPM